jgi:hypothetical protein
VPGGAVLVARELTFRVATGMIRRRKEFATEPPLLQPIAGQIHERRRHTERLRHEQECAARPSRGHSLGR